jgi:hypothetical protein
MRKTENLEAQLSKKTIKQNLKKVIGGLKK